MKLKYINKFQEGGGMPFVVYQPSKSIAQEQPQQSQQVSKTNEESKNPELLSKEIINELIKKGLPNEVNNFLNDLSSIEQMNFGQPIDRNALYSLTSKANQIIYNSNLMGEALTQAYNNDGLEELAVTATGQLYVKDSNGNIGKVSLSDYNKKRNKYQALTVNDLSKARSYDSNLAFDSDVIGTIQNSLGINKISEYMLDIIGKVGSESLTNSGYIDKNVLGKKLNELSGKTPTQQELKGIEEIANTYQSLGKEGIYKITTESKTQRNHISDGFEYLWSLLPNNARNVLKARYVIDDNEYANPVNLIRNAFIKHTSESNSRNIDYDSSMNKNSNESSSEKTHNQGTLEALVNGDIGKTTYNINNPEDTSYNLALSGNMTTQLSTANEQLVPATTLTNAFNSGVGKLIDKNNIYFGNQKISSSTFDKILYDGGEVAKVWMPITSSGDIDFDLLPNYTAAEEEIQQKNITSASDKNKIYKKHRVNMFLDANGNPISTSPVGEFLVFTGASSTAVAKHSSNPYVFESIDQDGEKERMQTIFKSSGTKDNPIEYPDNNNWFGLSNAVKGPVFMKLSKTARYDAAYMAKKGSLVKTPTLEDDLINEKRNTVIGNSYNLYE